MLLPVEPAGTSVSSVFQIMLGALQRTSVALKRPFVQLLPWQVWWRPSVARADSSPAGEEPHAAACVLALQEVL